MKKLDLKPNSQEWLDVRGKYRTASEASIVMGISPFTSIRDFKLIKAGLKKQFYSSAMKQGHDLEAQVRAHANDHFDKDFKEEVWVNGEYLASLDGIDGDLLVEIKVSDYSYNKLIDDGEVPPNYMTQIQQQLYCSPATRGYLYVYSPKKDRYAMSYEIEQDPEFIPAVAAAWEKFDAMPVPESAIDMTSDGSIHAMFREYEMLKQSVTETTAKMDEIKATLVALSNQQGLVAGEYKLTKKEGSKTFDYKKAATEAKLDLEKYAKQGKPSFAITLPKNPFDV